MLERRNPGAHSNISQPSLKKLTLSSGGGSHLEVPCRGSLLGRDECKEKTKSQVNTQETREDLECGKPVGP